MNSKEVLHKFLVSSILDGQEHIQEYSYISRFMNSNPDANFSEGEWLNCKSNFIIGNDPSRWITGVNCFNKLYNHNIYNSIDVVYTSRGEFLKSDIIIHPGGNPEDILIGYEGVNHVRPGASGEIVISVQDKEFKEFIPEAYQLINGKKVIIPVRYELDGNNRVSFLVDYYDPNYDLVIDPQLIYSTYFGGSGDDLIYQSNFAHDSDGNIYISGRTKSSDFPVAQGSYSQTYSGLTDCFVLKLNPSATEVIYCTYIGGYDNDYSTNIMVTEPEREAIITGFTTSSDFPVTGGVIQPFYKGNKEGYVLKLNQTGSSLVFSTYLGSYEEDYIGDLELDTDKNLCMVGYSSGDFPTTPQAYQQYNSLFGTYDIFVTKLDPGATTLLYSTLIGGGYHDRGCTLKIGSTGDLFVYGTSAGDFPVTTNAFDDTYNGGINDVVLFKFNPTLSSLLSSTYLGSQSDDLPKGYGGFFLDSLDQPVLTGNCGEGFPTTGGAFSPSFNGGTLDAFITKMNTDLSNTLFSTYLGGEGEDCGYSITMDAESKIVLSGYAAEGFPTTACCYDNSYNGGSSDAFIARVNEDLSQVLYSTYFGGMDSEIANALSIQGDTVLIVGETRSANFPITPNAIDPTFNGGGRDVFVSMLKLIGSSSPIAAGPDDAICETDSYLLQNSFSFFYDSLSWTTSGTGYFNDPTLLHPTYFPSQVDILAGHVTLVVQAYSSCGVGFDSLMLFINKNAVIHAGPDLNICNNQIIEINGSTASSYSNITWTHDGEGILSGANTLNPVYTPSTHDAGLITLICHANGNSSCAGDSDTLYLRVSPFVLLENDSLISSCGSEAVLLSGLSASNYDSVYWTSAGSGYFEYPNQSNPRYLPSSEDLDQGSVFLTVSLTAYPPCMDTSATTHLFLYQPAIVFAGADAAICDNGSYTLVDASCLNAAALHWSVSPDTAGIFENPDSLHTLFIPAEGYSGTANLNLGAASFPGCETFAFDELSLYIHEAPQAEAGPDEQVPYRTVVELSGIASGGSGKYLWEWRPEYLLVDPSVPGPVSFPMEENCTFILQVRDSITGCESIDSLMVLVNDPDIDLLEIFNLLTPNCDGKNDTWIIRGIEEYPVNSVIIFNLWGDIIREYSGYDNNTTVWDGKNKNNEYVPDGTYFYILKIKEIGSRIGWIYVQCEH